VNPCSCTHLIFVKGSQNIHWKKPACEHWISTYRKMKPDPCSSSCTNTNS
jgi:hypothetical protein